MNSEEFPKKAAIRHKNYESNNSDAETTKKHKVTWDTLSLEEQERERRLHPHQKINEPKTPYHNCEDEDNFYLTKLNEINKIKPTVI